MSGIRFVIFVGYSYIKWPGCRGKDFTSFTKHECYHLFFAWGITVLKNTIFKAGNNWNEVHMFAVEKKCLYSFPKFDFYIYAFCWLCLFGKNHFAFLSSLLSFLYLEELCTMSFKSSSCSNFALFGKTRQLVSKKKNYNYALWYLSQSFRH